jgi:hypothetical protein
MDAVCLLALYIIMNGLGGVQGILRADAEGCIRFVASLMRERSGVLDDKWIGKVTPMASVLSCSFLSLLISRSKESRGSARMFC